MVKLSAAIPTCRACGRPGSRTWVARERYAGMPGEFVYGECDHCGSLSLGEIPSNLAEFYRAGYYSFANAKQNWSHRFLNGSNDNLRASLRVIPDKTSRILDVGCGAGHLLDALAQHGYTTLSGTDPFLPREETGQRGNIHLMNLPSTDLHGAWDVIMYHHALEHVADPVAEMKTAARLLAPGGRLLIRVPLADSWLRSFFGTDWYQWDAPRHIWLPSRQAFRELATKAGLRLVAEWQDAAVMPIFASRFYSRGQNPSSAEHSPLGRRKVLAKALPQLVADTLVLQWTKLTRRADQGCFLFMRET